MACKFNTYKSIHKGVPNILFTAAYLLFSAEICTRTAQNRSSSDTANPSLLSLTANSASSLGKGFLSSPSHEDGSVESLPVNVSIISSPSEALAVAKALEADLAVEEAVKRAETAKKAEALAVAKALEGKLATAAAAKALKELSPSEAAKVSAESVIKTSAAAKTSASAAAKASKVSLEEKSTEEMMAQAMEAAVKSVGVNPSKASKASKASEVNSAASEILSVEKASAEAGGSTAAPVEVSNLVVQSEVEKKLVPSEANTDGLKVDRPNLAHQARTDSHKLESSRGCNRVSQYSEPLFESREAKVGRSVAPLTKPKKAVRFIEDPEVRIFKVEEESAPAQRLVEAPLEGVGLSSAKSSLCKSLKKNTQKAWKKIVQKIKHKSPNSQSSSNADIPVDEQSKNDKNSNQMSQSIGLLSQSKEAGSADRSVESSAVSNSIVDLSPSTDNRLVDQPMEHNATKDAHEEKNKWQELDEALNCLRSFENSIVLTDNGSLDQPMENDATKGVQEQNIIKDMEDMVNIFESYLTRN